MRFDRVQNPLRAIAAELALLAPEDVEAITSELADNQRARLRELLAEHQTGAVYGRESSPTARTEMFSPWLAERIAGQGAAASGLTEQTRRTLVQLAAELAPAVERKARHTPTIASPGLFKRLMAGESWR